MTEGYQGGPMGGGVLSRRDRVASTGGCNFLERALPDLNTPTFRVGAFGGCGVAGCAGRGLVAARAWRGRGLGPGGCRGGAGSGLQPAGGGRAQGDVWD
ncbi:snRNA-activating protein complex subunit 3-like [Lemur catta]|uniref:snRNA-activating protein complex subunit 3-like n=1 Tax=Lemur catta TaxID=9447 RepID=UPI001E269D26|nr:snRNA-activating protein complex subunit 3-like [Lemur catta]